MLIVDDDRDVRALLSDTLAEAGHTVTQATNGLEALGMLRDGDVPCVVLSDVRMPRMDGWELSQAVARDAELSSVPIVLVTGDRMLSFTAPALDKPLAAAELDALVQRSCRLHRTTKADAAASEGRTAAEGAPVPGAG